MYSKTPSVIFTEGVVDREAWYKVEYIMQAVKLFILIAFMQTVLFKIICLAYYHIDYTAFFRITE